MTNLPTSKPRDRGLEPYQGNDIASLDDIGTYLSGPRARD